MANSNIVYENVVLACLISGVYDVNRNTVLAQDNFELIKEWAASLTARQVQGVIFHNTFSAETCATFSNQYISFIKIEYDIRFNPNIYRYFVYNNFLEQHKAIIKNVFVTDVSDVVCLNNPFLEDYYLQNKDSLFCGDEPKLLKNEWMVDHATHLRSKMADYADYEKKFENETLLNCGIIGGSIHIMKPLIEQICFIHEQYNFDNKTAYTGDMGAFNFVARTQFNQILKHGAPINTIFKAYQNERLDCWFRHK